MKRRFWAGLLSFVMLWSLLPASALATEEGTPEPGKVTATKTASTLNNDGTYTITLTVQGNPVEDKETTTTSANADVVLVVDNSGSMASSVGEPCQTPKSQFEKKDATLWGTGVVVYKCRTCGAKYYEWKFAGFPLSDVPDYCTGEKGVTARINAAKNVGKEFAKSILKENSGNRLAVIGFAHSNHGGGTDNKAIKVSQDLTNNLTTVNGALDKMDADGGTNYTAALQKAYDFLNDRTQKEKTSRPGYVIFISDGTPGLSGDSQNDEKWNGADQVKSIKNAGYTLYTVGIALDNTAADYLKSMASDAQNDHFINVTGTNYDKQLSTILKQWAVKITETTKKKPAGTNATLVDLINTDKFDYAGSASENLKVEEDNKTVTWTIDKIPEKPESATFKIKAKAGVYGKDIPTNDGNATLTYTDAKEQAAEIKLPSPTVDIEKKQYTVTYHANNGVTPEVTYTDTVTAGNSTTVRGAAADVGTFSVTLSNEISFECPGKKFKGWAETSDGAVKYAPGKEISNIVTNYDLYAVWDDSAVTETKYQLVYFAGSDGFLPGKTTQYATTSKADPTMYDKDATASVKYDDADFAITVTADQTLFIGWTEDSESVGKIYKLGDEVPTLVTEVKMTGDKAVYAVYGEDANHDGTPDVFQAKVTYKVVNGWWTDNGTVLPDEKIVAWFDLYAQQADHTWKKCSSDPVLGNTVPKGHSGQPGYTGAGWFMDGDSTTVMENGPDSTTQVTKPVTLYTFVYKDATHKTDIVDTLNAIVKKEFTKANNVESGDVTFTAKATITKQPEVVIQSLPEEESAGASHTILGTVTLSTKDGTGSFVFARSLDDVNPADGDYLVEVSEVNGGADNVTYDKQTFIVKITVKDGAVDKDSVRVYSVDGKEWVPVADGRITFKNTYTKSNSGGRDDDSDTYWLAIKKIDAQDGHVLMGAKFGLYVDDKQIATATSGSKGYARFSLDKRVYNKLDKNDDLYVMELTAPDGYVKSSRKYDVSVNAFVKNIGAQEHAITVTNSRSSTPDRLNDEEHFAYVIGYKDGNVRPYGLISRAETTTIFFRLLKDSVRDGNLLTSNTYTDVADNYWANTAISTMTGLGTVQGRTATTFDPYAPITRAQFAAICARFDDGKTQGGQTFTDIQGHWAQAYIERAAELGWIKGFEDGTFRPDTYITRAQAMTMINRVLNRIPEDADDLLSNMNVWPDCNPGDWFYLAVQEATNSHDYKHKAGNYETWSSMNKDPDWTRYEN